MSTVRGMETDGVSRREDGARSEKMSRESGSNLKWGVAVSVTPTEYSISLF
jgi:hypothetical protein